MNKSLLFLGICIGIGILFLWGSYNSLVSANEKIDGQWAQVEVQYQRRFDLIPNLVETVKGSMQQEKEVFLGISEARTRYSGAVSPEERAQAATQLESTLGRLLVIMENYPQLRSMESVQTLMAQLEGTENRVSVERSRYNETVQVYNVQIKKLPTKWIASSFGFSERQYFKAMEGSDSAPKVDL